MERSEFNRKAGRAVFSVRRIAYNLHLRPDAQSLMPEALN
jgi:hypothetical protein